MTRRPQHRAHGSLVALKRFEGTEQSPQSRHRGRPSAVRARIAATRQRAICPFFHPHSVSQRPHTGLVQHSPAAGISGFSSTPGLGLPGAEPPRHGAWGHRRAASRARNLLKLARRTGPGICSSVSARCGRPATGRRGYSGLKPSIMRDESKPLARVWVLVPESGNQKKRTTSPIRPEV